jgi:single-stranded-DNA-specific exonuclease
MKNYRVRERLHDELLSHLMLARGIAEDQFGAFLEPDFDRDSHDPLLLQDMKEAVARIAAAKQNNEHVAVWSDYDCDGIPGGVLLVDFLSRWGLNVTHYIPHRHKEGYGLNINGLTNLAAQGVTLVITVDLGTTNIDEIAFAKTKGIDTIVTDHHLVTGALPDALVLNPKRPDSPYPFDGLCGAGMAWKLVQGILVSERGAFADGQEKWLLDLAALGTLADMVPLVGENRMIARYGLLVMRKMRRPGLAALFKLMRISPELLTEDDIGFMVAPRINAASRMDNPHVAAKLLTTTDKLEGAALAKELQALNDDRKTLVALTVKEVNKRMAAMGTDMPVIVMGNPKWRPGILGLVANSLVEAHGKPVFLWGREGGDEIRGSCRSNGEVNMVELMQAASDIFVHFGGHSASGGFSVSDARVHELPAKLNEAYTKIQTLGGGIKEVVVDRELDLAELSHARRDLKKLAPFGIGNEKPLFIFPRVSIANSRMFGKQQNHLEFSLEASGARTSGIAFFSTPESFQKRVEVGEKADIVGHVETDWKGSPRIRVVDIL